MPRPRRRQPRRGGDAILYTSAEAARILGLAERTVRNRVASGWLVGILVNRRMMVLGASVRQRAGLLATSLDQAAADRQVEDQLVADITHRAGRRCR